MCVWVVCVMCVCVLNVCANECVCVCVCVQADRLDRLDRFGSHDFSRQTNLSSEHKYGDATLAQSAARIRPTRR